MKEEIILKLREFTKQVIKDNTPYTWVYEEEPFINIFGKLCYDYSGRVVKYTDVNDLEIDEDSTLDTALFELHIDRWVASYESNRGKNWVSYYSLLEDMFNDWKYKRFELYDEDGEELNEELEEEIDNIVYDFIQTETMKDYYQLLVDNIK